MKRYLNFLIILLIVTLFSCSTNIKTIQYLKLNDNIDVHFIGTFKIDPSDENYKIVEVIYGGKNPKDTSLLIEKYEWIKKTNDRIVDDYYLLNRKEKINSLDIFYNINKRDVQKKDYPIGFANFFQSVFLIKHDTILFFPLYYKNELNNISEKKFTYTFPITLHKKDTIIYYYKKSKSLLTNFRLEDIKIDNKKLKNCLYIKQMQTFLPYKDTSVSEAWYSKKYGLVKWIRATGRIETQVLK